MIKKFIIFFLIYCYVSCESDIVSITTVQPDYSVDQVDDNSAVVANQIENQKPKNLLDVVQARNSIEIDEIQVNDVQQKVVNEPSVKSKETKQVNLDDLNAQETATNSPLTEINTFIPEVTRVKRAPRYTVRELIFPFGVMHEVGHLRDEVVKRVSTNLARTSSNRVYIHHNYHHIPNHLAYLPVIGPLLDERNKRRN